MKKNILFKNVKLQNSEFLGMFLGFVKFEKYTADTKEAKKIDNVFTDYPNAQKWKYYWIVSKSVLLKKKDRISVKGGQSITYFKKEDNVKIVEIMKKYELI